MSRVNRRKFITPLIILAVIFTGVSSAFATDESPVGKDKFKLSLGGFFPAIDSQVRIDSKEFGEGTDIDLEDDLGFNENVELGRIEGYWRFKPKHRFYLGY